MKTFEITIQRAVDTLLALITANAQRIEQFNFVHVGKEQALLITMPQHANEQKKKKFEATRCQPTTRLVSETFLFRTLNQKKKKLLRLFLMPRRLYLIKTGRRKKKTTETNVKSVLHIFVLIKLPLTDWIFRRW